MISIIRSTPDHALESIEIEELRKRLNDQGLDDGTMLWIDLDQPTPEEEDLILIDLFNFHPLAVLDCRRERLEPEHGDHLPKVEDYDRYLFTVINPIDFDADQPLQSNATDPTLSTRQLNAFLGERFLITHHYEPSPGIRHAMLICGKNPKLFERGPDYIYHTILDEIVDQYTPVLEKFDEMIDRLENEVFRNPTRRTLVHILSLKRSLFRMKKTTSYQREMVYRLSRGEFDLINEAEIAYYRNVFDHLVRAADLADSYRELLTNLLDAYLSMTSNRMNETMKVLTIISTFFLPLTFIVGLYGMNFTNIPELHWRYGYAFAWGIMIAVAVAMILYFRKKKWL